MEFSDISHVRVPIEVRQMGCWTHSTKNAKAAQAWLIHEKLKPNVTTRLSDVGFVTCHKNVPIDEFIGADENEALKQGIGEIS
ncbi:MAG: hypothetical protein PVF33_02510 [Candidatus Latescibacterota bacterium]|jgi:hypothetical protein